MEILIISYVISAETSDLALKVLKSQYASFIGSSKPLDILSFFGWTFRCLFNFYGAKLFSTFLNKSERVVMSNLYPFLDTFGSSLLMQFFDLVQLRENFWCLCKKIALYFFHIEIQRRNTYL